MKAFLLLPACGEKVGMRGRGRLAQNRGKFYRRVGKGAKRRAHQRRAHQPLWQARMSRYRRLKIEGGAFFFTLRSPTVKAICWYGRLSGYGAPMPKRKSDIRSKLWPSAFCQITSMPCGSCRMAIPITPRAGASSNPVSHAAFPLRSNTLDKQNSETGKGHLATPRTGNMRFVMTPISSGTSITSITTP